MNWLYGWNWTISLIYITQIKSTTWLIVMLKGVKLGNMDKIDNVHDNRNIKNCDCMNNANAIYHVDHTNVTSHVDGIQPNGWWLIFQGHECNIIHVVKFIHIISCMIHVLQNIIATWWISSMWYFSSFMLVFSSMNLVSPICVDYMVWFAMCH